MPNTVSVGNFLPLRNERGSSPQTGNDHRCIGVREDQVRDPYRGGFQAPVEERAGAQGNGQVEVDEGVSTLEPIHVCDAQCATGLAGPVVGVVPQGVSWVPVVTQTGTENHNPGQGVQERNFVALVDAWDKEGECRDQFQLVAEGPTIEIIHVVGIAWEYTPRGSGSDSRAASAAWFV